MSGTVRPYRARKDRKSVQRVWQECGWISDEKREFQSMDSLVRASDAWVYDLNGSAECLVLSTDGTYHHTGTPLKLAAITAVTTSRVARNQKAATATLARCLAHQARSGMHVSGLGIFEQGYYDRFGYGNGTYEQLLRFDPAWLVDLGRPRVPVRLTADDWQEIHDARLARRKRHGAVDLLPAAVTRCEMEWSKSTFGLGYRENGTLTHFLVGRDDNKENGPYQIDWLVYRNIDEFRELMAVLRGLGDQVRSVRMREPRDIQMQSLLKKPFQLFTLSGEGKFESRVRSFAYWQMRILDLPRCVAALEVPTSVEFNLTLTDPLTKLLPADAQWSGCGGDYHAIIGPVSSAEPGHEAGLPVLTATVNDFTRFWMGSVQADVLAGLHSFSGPPELIATLDEAVQLRPPAPDWDY